MARGTTTAKTPGKPARKRRQSSGSIPVTLTVMVIVGLALTALPLCILVVAGLLPTAVAVVVDRHRRRYLARTVGAMNLAGVLPGALQIWTAGISFSSLQQTIDSPYNWLVMYGAAAVGWVLYFCVPPVVAMVIEVRVDESKRRLEARAKALVDEWGEEVTGRKADG
ncbi:MAG TPA: hypothetical protein VE397_03345 [Stellaceae bacterium]|jgi:hypothetical protein|nr:hypothetical protein [Stellaceae bacterium]